MAESGPATWRTLWGPSRMNQELAPSALAPPADSSGKPQFCCLPVALRRGWAVRPAVLAHRHLESVLSVLL